MSLFCPKCGSLMKLGAKAGKKVLECSCGFSKEKEGSTTMKEKGKPTKIEIADEEIETNPITKADCPKCGHGEAHYWEVQTRAADEAATRFFKCAKCKHIWREY